MGFQKLNITSMNNQIPNIQERLDNALEFKNEEELDLFEFDKIQLDIIAQLEDYMEVNKIQKSDIAKALNTSKSYITQLFTGDKILNLKTLAKLQRKFNIKFKVSLFDLRNDRSLCTEDIEIDKYNRENHPNVFNLVKTVNPDIIIDLEGKYLYPDNNIKDIDYSELESKGYLKLDNLKEELKEINS